MLAKFEKLILLRILKEDCLESLIMNFIESTLGEKYLDFPGFDLKEGFLDSNKFTPILLILSSGADPSNNFK